LDGRKPDYIINIINNINSKVILLEYRYKNNLLIISLIDIGYKSDPICIFISDILANTENPLSRFIYRRLHAVGVASDIPIVYSTEKPGPGKIQLLPLPEEEFQNNIIAINPASEGEPKGFLIDIDLGKELNSVLSKASH
jgi:tRNA A37 threonylcarbamoyladenosine dehydratase